MQAFVPLSPGRVLPLLQVYGVAPSGSATQADKVLRLAGAVPPSNLHAGRVLRQQAQPCNHAVGLAACLWGDKQHMGCDGLGKPLAVALSLPVQPLCPGRLPWVCCGGVSQGWRSLHWSPYLAQRSTPGHHSPGCKAVHTHVSSHTLLRHAFGDLLHCGPLLVSLRASTGVACCARPCGTWCKLLSAASAVCRMCGCWRCCVLL